MAPTAPGSSPAVEPTPLSRPPAGLIRPDWPAAFPNNSIVCESVCAIVVRAGNPKNIRGWEDLGEGGAGAECVGVGGWVGVGRGWHTCRTAACMAGAAGKLTRAASKPGPLGRGVPAQCWRLQHAPSSSQPHSQRACRHASRQRTTRAGHPPPPPTAARDDVAVITANPKTAGVARWIFLALWGAKLSRGKKAATQYVTKARRGHAGADFNPDITPLSACGPGSGARHRQHRGACSGVGQRRGHGAGGARRQAAPPCGPAAAAQRSHQVWPGPCPCPAAQRSHQAWRPLPLPLTLLPPQVFDQVVVQPRDAREASDVFYRQVGSCCRPACLLACWA